MPEFQRFTKKDKQDQLKFAACSGVVLLAFGAVSIISSKAEAFGATYNAYVQAKYNAEKDHSDEFAVMVPIYEDQSSDIASLSYMEQTSAVDSVEDTVVASKHTTLFSDSYYDLNTALLEYASKYASFDFHGVQFDGLAVMAQANTESDYMCDATKSISALYPSRWLTLDSVDDIANCNCAYVWMFGGLDSDCIAWSTGGGINEQGPLQQRVPNSAIKYLSEVGAGSEYDILKYSGILDSIGGKRQDVVSYCTGAPIYTDYNLTGDRFNIRDNCIIWKVTKQEQLEVLWDRYYATVEYNPNIYEYLVVLAYSHWIPGVVSGDNDSVNYFGFGYSNSWFDIAHALSSEESIEVITRYVHDYIDNNRALVYEDGYTIEDALSRMEFALYNTVDSTGKSVPDKIFTELLDRGILSRSMFYENQEYSIDHAKHYGIQYLYSYIMLDELLINRY